MAGSETRGVAHARGRWLGDATVFHGEGAFWDARTGSLRYVDMLRGDVLTHSDALDDRTKVGDVAALIRHRASGGYVVAVERGFALLDDALRVHSEIPAFDDALVRMNEGACDAAGRLYCGSLAYDYRHGGGKLYRLDPDLSVHVVLDRVTIPNGLVWTESGSIALHADTAENKVYAYAFDSTAGTFGDRDVFIDFSETAGSPDGMALDVDGGVWIAMWGGGSVRRYDAAGALSDVVTLPVTNVTSCSIGGENETTLFVTTSRQGLVGRLEENAGRVYATDIGVRGVKLHSFGG